jgi:hypothetical protein
MLLNLGICDSLVLIDVNPLAVKLAKITIEKNELQDKVVVYESNILRDIPLSEAGSWDLVVANPPHFLTLDDMLRWYPSLQVNLDVQGEPGRSEQRTHELRGVDAGWMMHRTFYGTVNTFLRPGGHIIWQENWEGAAPEDLLPLIHGTGLKIAGIHDSSFPGYPRFWYMHTYLAPAENDDSAWWLRRDPPITGDSGCRMTVG